MDLLKSRIDSKTIALLAFAVRLPGVFHENIPHQFCDEAIYSNELERMLLENSILTKVFLAGGVNLYPTFLIARFSSIFGLNISIENLILFTRLSINILNAVTVIVIYKIAYQITQSMQISRNASLLFAFSGYAISQSKLWYPDSYSVFIYTLFFYFVLKLKANFSLRDNLYAGIIFGTAISIKYNLASAILIYCIALIYHWKEKSSLIKLKLYIAGISIFSVISFLIFSIINFSIYKNFAKFYYDVATNAHIYRPGPGIHFSAPIFYFVCMIIIPFTIWSIPLFYTGARKLTRVNVNLFLTPIFIYILVMSRADQVLNRNINAFLGLISIIIAIGLEDFLKRPNRLRVIFISVFISTFFILSGYNILKELQKDSYEEANRWLRSNISKSEIVGINEPCFYQNEAKLAGLNTEIDPKMNKRLKYYVFNSYWNNSTFTAYSGNNIIQEFSTKYLHFYHYSDDSLLKFNISRDLSSELPNGYALKKVFSGSGEDIIVIERKN